MFVWYRCIACEKLRAWPVSKTHTHLQRFGRCSVYVWAEKLYKALADEIPPLVLVRASAAPDGRQDKTYVTIVQETIFCGDIQAPRSTGIQIRTHLGAGASPSCSIKACNLSTISTESLCTSPSISTIGTCRVSEMKNKKGGLPFYRIRYHTFVQVLDMPVSNLHRYTTIHHTQGEHHVQPIGTISLRASFEHLKNIGRPKIDLHQAVTHV